MPMKYISRSVFLVLMLSSSGCSLFGWYMNGDSSPTLTTEMEDWTKSNTDQAQRMKDWISCGGNSAGHVHFTPVTHDGPPTPGDYIQANKEYDAAQACMMKKGYHYTGSCRGQQGLRLACKGKSIFNL